MLITRNAVKLCAFNSTRKEIIVSFISRFVLSSSSLCKKDRRCHNYYYDTVATVMKRSIILIDVTRFRGDPRSVTARRVIARVYGVQLLIQLLRINHGRIRASRKR